MNILILDDNEYVRMTVKKIVEETDSTSHLLIASTYDEAMAYLDKNEIHAAYLDIHVDEDTVNRTGLSIAAAINKKYPQAKILIISAFPAYALKSFEVHPYDFIVKPIDLNYLKEITEHLIKDFKERRKVKIEMPIHRGKLCIRTTKEMFLLPYDDILFIEKIQKDIVIQTTTTEHTVRWTLNELEDILPNYFMRVHKSYIVNLHRIRHISEIGDRTYEIYFENMAKSALMSRYKAQDVFEALEAAF